MTKEEIIHSIFQTLQSQKFADWYNGVFSSWILGDVPLTKQEIEKDIEKLFNLK